MFTKNVRFIEIDLTNICNARCPQCPRYDLDYRLKPGLNKNSLSVEDIKYGIDQKYWLTIDNIEHSGATGEPTLNPSVLEILEYEIQQLEDHEMEFTDYIVKGMDEYDSNTNLTDYDEENFGCQSGDDDGRELNFD